MFTSLLVAAVRCMIMAMMSMVMVMVMMIVVMAMMVAMVMIMLIMTMSASAWKPVLLTLRIQEFRRIDLSPRLGQDSSLMVQLFDYFFPIP